MQKYFSVTSSDRDILKKDILRELVYRRAEELFVFKNAVVEMPVDALEAKFDIPKVTRFTPEQVMEGAVAGMQQLGFYQVTASLQKYQTRVRITDESKIRQIANNQVQMSIEAAAQGMAYQMDYEIVTALLAATGNNVAAGTAWDASTSGPSPATDIADAIGKILTGTTILPQDVKAIGVYYPAGLLGHILKPMEIGDLRETFKTWAGTELGLSFFPTRMLTNRALVVLKSPETALHMTYSGGNMPLAEQERIVGVGEDYLITRYFVTKVLPDSSTVATNSRLCTINGITT